MRAGLDLELVGQRLCLGLAAGLMALVAARRVGPLRRPDTRHRLSTLTMRYFCMELNPWLMYVLLQQTKPQVNIHA